MDFNKLSWFTSGLIVGSILDTKTTLALIISWIILTNEPIPEILGGYRPQQIIGGIVRGTVRLLTQYTPKYVYRSKKIDNNSSDIEIIESINSPIVNDNLIQHSQLQNQLQQQQLQNQLQQQQLQNQLQLQLQNQLQPDSLFNIQSQSTLSTQNLQPITYYPNFNLNIAKNKKKTY